MSTRIDKPFDEYPKGATPVSRAYRVLADDAPPPELDAAILAKARVAIAAQPSTELQQHRWRRFSVPLALAASVVMVVSIVLEVSKQPMPIPTIEPQSAPAASDSAGNAPPVVITVPLATFESAPPEVAVQMMPPAAQPAEADAQQSRERKEPAAKPPDNAALAETTASPPLPAAPALSRGNIAADSTELRQQEKNSFSKATTGISMAKAVGAATPAETKSELSDQVQRDPAQWLAAIQTLRAAGKTQDADREWLAFRKAWPNYPVAPADTSSSQNSQAK